MTAWYGQRLCTLDNRNEEIPIISYDTAHDTVVQLKHVLHA